MAEQESYRVEVPDLGYFGRQVLCQGACPVGTDAGRYVSLIADGRLREAYLVARQPNPFASICGRICAHPCEAACRRNAIDQPVSIRALKRVVTDLFGPESLSGIDVATALQPPAPAMASGGKVAIIGAGPAGLSCAHDLALLGHQAEVFEASPVAGGMLRLGVPEYRLPRSILGAEIRVIEDLGVKIHLNSAVGRDRSFSDLLASFDAVFIGAGCMKARSLAIPGVELDGVLAAVDFLLNVNLGYRVALGQRVAIVGGGNVAFDVARTATRLATDSYDDDADHHLALDAARAAVREGARQVTLVALESEAEMPADPEELDEGQQEGVEVIHSRGPHAILGEEGRVRALQTLDVSRVFDDEGRFSPQFVEGSLREIECDSVILAVGQTVDLDFLGTDHGVELSGRGFVAVDPTTMETSVAGVYAGGDAAFGPRIAINAVADGRRAALAIHRRLGGSIGWRAEYDVVDLPLAAYRPAGGHDPGYDTTPRQAAPMLPTGRRVGQAEVEQRFSPEKAVCEASRCLRCWIAPVFDSSRCILCAGCADVCPELCLKLVPASQLVGDATFDDLRSAVAPEGTEMSAIIKDEDACTRCGLCAMRCPVDAITMEAIEPRGMLRD